MFDHHLFWFSFGMVLGVALTGAIAIGIMSKLMRALRESFEEKKPL